MVNTVEKEVQKSASPSETTTQFVYLFDELDEVERKVTPDNQPSDWDHVRALLGGKGANLAEMTRLGVPVPPGFTVTTEACNAYLSHDRQFPPQMWEQEVEAM